MRSSGVYSIDNLTNGKRYIGSAVSLRQRRYKHLCDLKKGRHHSEKLQRAWDKYGGEAFAFRVLFVCSRADLIFYEQRAIDVFDSVRSGYNVNPVAGSSAGRPLSEKARRALSEFNKNRPPDSAETREKRNAANRGQKRTPEQRARISAGAKARKVSEETKERLRKMGREFKTHSAEAREKIRAARSGTKWANGRWIRENGK